MSQLLKTKIVSTIGPKSGSKEIIAAMIQNGMSMVRLNMTHCSYSFAEQVINIVRELSTNDCQIGILIDMNGPKVRTGRLRDGAPIHLAAGRPFTFVQQEDIFGDENMVSTTYPHLAQVVKPGDRILVNDGLLGFTVTEISENKVHCIVDNSGVLGERKGLNMPMYIPEDVPTLSQKDVDDIRFAIKHKADFVTVSCMRSSTDVMEVRKLLGISRIKMLSKIENQCGLNNFDSILAFSDGIILDRGYLGVEDVQSVALHQKEIISRCNLVGKPVLVANQVLESLTEYPRPSRSEASDITSALSDGVDGLILSTETSVGMYPIESVIWLMTICLKVEANIDYFQMGLDVLKNVAKPVGISESISSSAVKCARDVGATCIIAVTEAGGAARLISKYRSHLPVIAVTDDVTTCRQLTCSFGIHPALATDITPLERAFQLAVAIGLAKKGDLAVVSSGRVNGFKEGFSTEMRVVKVE